jgi:hypothetical protein
MTPYPLAQAKLLIRLDRLAEQVSDAVADTPHRG